MSSSLVPNNFMELFQVNLEEARRAVVHKFVCAASQGSLSDVCTMMGDRLWWLPVDGRGEAFFAAAAGGHVNVMNIILDLSPSYLMTDIVNYAKPERGNATALMIASATGNNDATRIILSSGGDAMRTDDYGRVALHYATTFDVAARLVASFPDGIWIVDKYGHSPVHSAAIRGSSDVLNAMYVGAPSSDVRRFATVVNQVDGSGHAAVELAVLAYAMGPGCGYYSKSLCSDKYQETMKSLFTCGARIETVVNNDGGTKEHSPPRIVCLLDVLVNSLCGESSRSMSPEGVNAMMASLIMHAKDAPGGLDSHRSSNDGMTALAHVVTFGAKNVRLSPSQGKLRGVTLLMIINIMLTFGAWPKTPDRDGKTAMSRAAEASIDNRGDKTHVSHQILALLVAHVDKNAKKCE
jgi:hypothetical protein